MRTTNYNILPKTQSFTKQVKEEIIKNAPAKSCCQETLFAGLIYFNCWKKGTDTFFVKNAKKVSVPFFQQLFFTSSMASLARLVLKLAKKFSGQESLWGFKENKKGKNYRYIIFLPQNYNEKKLHLSVEAQYIVPPKKTCCRRAFLAALFLERGSIESPHRGYHLEFIVGAAYMRPLRQIIKLFQKEKLNPKYYVDGKFYPVRRTRPSNGVYRVYFKKADNIAKFLNIVKAHNALLLFEEKRAIKETKNDVRRMVNCETGNLEKTMEASFRQLTALERINETIGLLKLPKKLLEVAVLRLENPQASLSELAAKTDPQISRLEVSRKLAKIEEIAEGLKSS